MSEYGNTPADKRPVISD